MNARFCSACIWFGIMVVMTGCNQPSRPPEAPRAVENVYNLSLEFRLRDATGAEEFYTVDRDGAFGFGGGMDARLQRVSYTSILNDSDMGALRKVIEDQRLRAQPLRADRRPPDARVHVQIKMDGESIDRSIKGEVDHLQPLRSLLRDFANRRLLPELERQPKASGATQPATTPDR